MSQIVCIMPQKMALAKRAWNSYGLSRRSHNVEWKFRKWVLCGVSENTPRPAREKTMKNDATAVNMKRPCHVSLSPWRLVVSEISPPRRVHDEGHE